MDKDLASVQKARDLVARAYEAWKAWSRASQADVDRVCAAMAEAGYQAAERLGRLAQEETGYGVAAHKKLKNEFSSRMIWNSLRDMKTVGSSCTSASTDAVIARLSSQADAKLLDVIITRVLQITGVR